MAEASEGLLFIGGEGPPADRIAPYLEGAGLVVAADSGYDLARSAGCEPSLLVGDMDSIRGFAEAEGRIEAGNIISFDREKDETDTEIGLRLLNERGITSVTLVGGGGGRLDHLIGLLSLFDRELRPKRWLTARELVVSIEEEERFEAMRGVVCSFFPVGEEPATMRSRGLRWELDGLTWKHGDVGISNYAVEDRVTVTMLSGRLIMVRNVEGRPDG